MITPSPEAGLRLKSLIRDVPDFPKKGILFKDITPVLKDFAALGSVTDAFAAFSEKVRPAIVAGIESRGFIFGALLAQRLQIPFVPIRKKGKLPYRKISETYALEYGEDSIEIHEDAFDRGDRVLIVDDLLATGGTLAAAVRLTQKLGGVVGGCVCVIELSFLLGRRKLAGTDVYSIVTY